MTQSVGVNNVSGATASMLSAALVLGLHAVLGEARYSSIGWRMALLAVVPVSIMATYLTRHAVPESNDYAEHDVHLEEDCCHGSVNNCSNAEHDNDKALHGKQMLPLEESHEVSSPDDPTPMWLILVVSIYIQFTIASYNNLNVIMVQYAQENYGVSDNMATLMAVIGKAVQVVMTFPLL